MFRLLLEIYLYQLKKVGKIKLWILAQDFEYFGEKSNKREYF